MKKIKVLLCVTLMLSLLPTQFLYANEVNVGKTNPTNINEKTLNESESRVGKVVRVYVDEQGNTTTTVVEKKAYGVSTLDSGDIVLIATHRLSAAQTSQMKSNIQGMTQVANLAAALMPFVPQPYAAIFLAAARVSIFAEDVRWAGAYGHAIVMKEYCKLPHTSYSHYFEYEII